jgi:threonine dehydrogenase-like Zn-dependent dehydrogenase
LSADASIEALSGELTYPIRYGYAAVGRVDAVGETVSEEWIGQRVFSFQPHVSAFTASLDDIVPVPQSVRTEDAVMVPTLETAATLLLDGRPVLGERVVIFGQGVVGLLTTALVSQYPVECVLTVEPLADRRALSVEWGADRAFAPSEELDSLQDVLDVREAEAIEVSENGYQGADLVFELSGTPSTLNDALSIIGYDGQIILGSWYGEKAAEIHLGGRFHRSRIQMKSSQVSSIDPSLRGRWTKQRRMTAVLNLLESIRPGDLITTEYEQEQASEAYNTLVQVDASSLQPIFRY